MVTVVSSFVNYGGRADDRAFANDRGLADDRGSTVVKEGA